MGFTRITSTTHLRPHRLQTRPPHPLFRTRRKHRTARKRRGLRTLITRFINTPPLAPTTSALTRSTRLPHRRQTALITLKPLIRNHIRTRKIHTQHILRSTTRNPIPPKTPRLLSTRRINPPRPQINRRLSPLRQETLRIRHQRSKRRQVTQRLIR